SADVDTLAEMVVKTAHPGDHILVMSNGGFGGIQQPQHIPWQVAEVAEACVQPAHWSADVDTLAEMVVKTAHPGDHILVMSNGGFGGI
ncbi:hypothetical protein, partial [Enterococcus faecium]|uniref:hypothetical protein n=1 Tax=Enterococcus faecium TaxID=1352 RepID=UPI000BDAF0B9